MTHYIIIRTDLSLGLLAANICHAAGESIKTELTPGTAAVILAVDSERELRFIAEKLTLQGVEYVLITESEGAHANECMAIGVVPLVERIKVKPILGKLPLLKSLQASSVN